MSRRAPLPLPLALNDMYHSMADNLYCITRAGVTYKMSYELMNDLKLRYKMFESVADWYASLSRAERQSIIREGVPPAAPDPYFYPDVEP